MFSAFLPLLTASLLLVSSVANFEQLPCYSPSSTFFDISGNHGYEAEEYDVTTEDGYILKMFRIPNGQSQQNPKPVAFLQHGFLDSSDFFVENSPDKALAFILAQEGYDVFVGNSRGNIYSRQHVSLDPDTDSEFWDFSWVEMGRFDIPASIQKALEISGASKLSYIGHSQGTTQMFVLLSQSQVWVQDRVSSFVALGPAINMKHTTSSFVRFLAKSRILDLALLFGIKELLPRTVILHKMISFTCNYVPQICNLGLDLISEGLPELNNELRFSVIFSHFPAGTSVQTFNHYLQGVRSGEFRYYNYDWQKNLDVYNRIEAPRIHIERIKNFPIQILVGNQDQLATVEDARLLRQNLGQNTVEEEVVMEFGHETFILGKDMSYIKQYILPFLRKHESKVEELE